MDEHPASPNTRRKHLLSDEQLASHAGASADDLTNGHRQGNGLRIHGTYFSIVSIAALVLLVVVISIASVTMGRG